ncbi:hypothetical protein NNJEOMEG_00301 [Fundidesulfovibrio magnetotacticus]|uniref:Glycine zipper domain-containing protein n=1 Tax=Fundidesulfovibrio magnetotacticus TaxID=2730080 RepID=A0A6V8LRR2_9BACT|nr:hypothetical protein [Fundidesulfovibrio magnetotacticus]GFK92476.1 hypothetical protein NNJEOMEG_00301 [Fundidesulfovibrio magnetotacticus]
MRLLALAVFLLVHAECRADDIADLRPLTKWGKTTINLLQDAARMRAEPQRANGILLKAVGGVVGGVAGGAAGGALTRSKIGAVAGAVAGGIAGAKIGEELGKPVDYAGQILTAVNDALERSGKLLDAMETFMSVNNTPDDLLLPDMRAARVEIAGMADENVAWRRELYSRPVNREAAFAMPHDVMVRRCKVLVLNVDRLANELETCCDFVIPAPRADARARNPGK